MQIKKKKNLVNESSAKEWVEDSAQKTDSAPDFVFDIVDLMLEEVRMCFTPACLLTAASSDSTNFNTHNTTTNLLFSSQGYKQMLALAV